MRYGDSVSLSRIRNPRQTPVPEWGFGPNFWKIIRPWISKNFRAAYWKTTNFSIYRNINARNCKSRTFDELHLKGDISWGADVQFKNEALQATRLANFISAFMQVVDPKEVFPGTRVTDKPLTEDQMIGEWNLNIYLFSFLKCIKQNLLISGGDYLTISS